MARRGNRSWNEHHKGDGERANSMRIELRRPYKSIATLTTEELPNFAILIGRNGAGKTQLLDALKEGQAVIPDIGVDEIELYDMVSFHPPNTSVANRQVNQLAKVTAEAYLSPPSGQPPVKTAEAIFYQFASEVERDSSAKARDDFERNLRDEIRRLPDFAVFAGRRPRISIQGDTLSGGVGAP